MEQLLYSYASGSSSSDASSADASPSSEATSTTSDDEWLEEKRGNFVKLLCELAIVDERLIPWADKAESAPLTAFLAYMRLENAAVADAPPEEAQALALRAVDRAALLLGADIDALEFKSKRIKLARYTILFSA